MSDRKVSTDINVKDIGSELYDYIKSTGIPISTFTRMALREKMDRDKK